MLYIKHEDELDNYIKSKIIEHGKSFEKVLGVKIGIF